MGTQGAFAAERGTWELFLKDGQEAGDLDLGQGLEGRQLQCLLQGLRWLLCLLREPMLQVWAGLGVRLPVARLCKVFVPAWGARAPGVGRIGVVDWGSASAMGLCLLLGPVRRA